MSSNRHLRNLQGRGKANALPLLSALRNRSARRPGVDATPDPAQSLTQDVRTVGQVGVVPDVTCVCPDARAERRPWRQAPQRQGRRSQTCACRGKPSPSRPPSSRSRSHHADHGILAVGIALAVTQQVPRPIQSLFCVPQQRHGIGREEDEPIIAGGVSRLVFLQANDALFGVEVLSRDRRDFPKGVRRSSTSGTGRGGSRRGSLPSRLPWSSSLMPARLPLDCMGGFFKPVSGCPAHLKQTDRADRMPCRVLLLHLRFLDVHFSATFAVMLSALSLPWASEKGVRRSENHCAS